MSDKEAIELFARGWFEMEMGFLLLGICWVLAMILPAAAMFFVQSGVDRAMEKRREEARAWLAAREKEKESA